MAEQRVQRKLTTILVADVEGYSRLMHAHQEATLETLGDYREIIDRPKFPWPQIPMAPNSHGKAQDSHHRRRPSEVERSEPGSCTGIGGA